VAKSIISVVLAACAVSIATPNSAQAERITVTNLPFDVDSAELEGWFSPIGTVYSAVVLVEEASGRSRGVGIVEMDCRDALNAVQSLNGANADGRTISVQFAAPDGGNCNGAETERY
jgi:RNA recognition motif-containing protein